MNTTPSGVTTRPHFHSGCTCRAGNLPIPPPSGTMQHSGVTTSTSPSTALRSLPMCRLVELALHAPLTAATWPPCSTESMLDNSMHTLASRLRRASQCQHVHCSKCMHAGYETWSLKRQNCRWPHSITPHFKLLQQHSQRFWTSSTTIVQ